MGKRMQNQASRGHSWRPGVAVWSAPRGSGLLLPSVLLGLIAGCSGTDPDVSPTPTPVPTPEYVPEPDASLQTPTSWDNALVYFVITDRFYDGDPSNNSSYGRALDGENETGTFHGGDLKGLTDKLNAGYFTSLGVSALWITAPYEQVHGWVVGGNSEFEHYAYHGYYALDYTRLDANFGTEDELKTFVDSAHAHGIRVLMDVVMNHPGYATLQDLAEFQVDVLKPGWESATVKTYYDYIDYNSPRFADWWGVNWIRAGLGGGYTTGGTDDLTKSVAYLPDFITESTTTDIGLPPFYDHKSDTGAVEDPSFTVRQYLIEWLTRWVADYGIDGFRCDTVKHVEKDAWNELKQAGHEALNTWRENHASDAFSDTLYPDPSQPFWMVGEVFPHGVSKDDYFDNGFDALINFDFQTAAAGALTSFATLDGTWQQYAQSINTDPDFNMLSYLSSHDTSLFFSKYAGNDFEKQKRAGSLLLLSPGAVQLFYGDENARPPGPNSTDATQPTRSDYQWDANPSVLNHFRKLGQFRHHHEAVGAGSHEKISETPYTFRRALGSDVVYIVLPDARISPAISVGRDFADGTRLRNYYTGEVASVSGGEIRFADTAAPVLVERAQTP